MAETGEDVELSDSKPSTGRMCLVWSVGNLNSDMTLPVVLESCKGERPNTLLTKWGGGEDSDSGV